MKNLSLLVWLTQLGLGVAIFVGIALGLYCAFQGLMTSLKTMKRLSDSKEKEKFVAYNDHD